MTIDLEVIVLIVINILLGGVYIGGLAAALHYIEKQLKRLEDKQDKYNNLIMRTFKLEERSESQEKKLDELHDDIKELRHKVNNGK